MSTIAIPFKFTTYGTATGGLQVGRIVTDASTGYRYMFCQAHTDWSGDVGAIGQIACQVSATQLGVVTNKASVGLDTTYPQGRGIIWSAVPESTASTTYYFWTLWFGYTGTLLNDGTDQAAGDNLYVVAADPASAGRLAGTATNTDDGVGHDVFGRAATTVTGTNSTAWVNFDPCM